MSFHFYIFLSHFLVTTTIVNGLKLNTPEIIAEAKKTEKNVAEHPFAFYEEKNFVFFVDYIETDLV